MENAMSMKWTPTADTVLIWTGSPKTEHWRLDICSLIVYLVFCCFFVENKQDCSVPFWAERYASLMCNNLWFWTWAQIQEDNYFQWHVKKKKKIMIVNVYSSHPAALCHNKSCLFVKLQPSRGLYLECLVKMFAHIIKLISKWDFTGMEKYILFRSSQNTKGCVLICHLEAMVRELQ